MMDFFDTYENSDDGSFSEFQKAMEDTVVIAASNEAKRRADLINLNGSDETDEDENVSKHLDELNAMVPHVMHSEVTLAGRMQRCIRGDDSEFFIAQETPGQFHGFVSSRRDDLLHFDLAFAVPIETETDEVLTTERITAAAEEGETLEYSTQLVQAVPGEVFVEFNNMHPIRAKAILETTYPDTLRDIDDRIIHLSDTSDEDAILGLRGFSVNVDDNDTNHDNVTYIRAIVKYISGMVSIDGSVPYLLTVDGTYITADENGVQDLSATTVKGQLMTVHDFGLYSFTETDAEDDSTGELSFGLKGVWFTNDLDAPSTDVILPIESIVSFRSLRRLVAEAYPTEEATL